MVMPYPSGSRTGVGGYHRLRPRVDAQSASHSRLSTRGGPEHRRGGVASTAAGHDYHVLIAVAGASGFVGSRLCVALEEAGHTVRALTRAPERYRGAGIPMAADVQDAASLTAALAGCDAAYYLVHSLDAPDFEDRDAAGARLFGTVAGQQELQRLVYLGGLGDDADELSAHLRSRREVERLLGFGRVPVTTLRAGIIVGHGGISWEITRQLVERLPAMVAPQWVHTRTQPIALADVVRYLVRVLQAPVKGSRAFDIGGPDILEYVEMLRRVAAIEGRPVLIVPVPLLTRRLSSRGLSLVTDVDNQTGRSLIDSMSNEVVVQDDSIRRLVPLEPMSYEDAVRAALRERAEDEGGAPSSGRAVVAAATAVAGATLLGASLSTRPGSWQFYALTSGVAATWAAGGLASGTVPRGGEAGSLRQGVVAPVLMGVAAFAAFYGCAHVARRVPVLEQALSSVLAYAEHGNNPLVLLTALANGAAEEAFFRGALFDVLGDQHPAALSTVAYTAVTGLTRNPALVLAAAVMGSLFAAQRQASGGVQAPMLTHLTWSALMLRYLPPLFAPRRSRKGPRRAR